MFHGDTFKWPDNDYGDLAKEVFTERYGIKNVDVCALLAHDGDFVRDHEGVFHFIFGDVPFGYFRGLTHDVRFSEKQIRIIMRGAKIALHAQGSIGIRIGEHDKDLWVNIGKECGLHTRGMLMSC